MFSDDDSAPDELIIYQHDTKFLLRHVRDLSPIVSCICYTVGAPPIQVSKFEDTVKE